MKLSPDAEKYLLPAKNPGGFCPDANGKAVIELLTDYRTAETLDVGIVGVPYDTSVMYRPGCRFGPNSIRDSLMFFNTYEPGLDCDLDGLKIADFGNVDVLHTDVLETHRRVEAVVGGITKSGIIPLVFGGDHSLSYPNIKGLLNSLSGNVGVIMFDGHLDVRSDHHGMISSGTPFRRLIEEPKRNPMNPKNLVEIGINGWLASKYYMDYCRNMGITVIPAREVHRRGIEEVVAQAVEIAGKGVDAIWISVDIDGLDLAYAPGTCAPNPGGLTSYQALEAIWTIAQHPLCHGMDLLEVSPPWDVQNITSLTAGALAMNFLGGIKTKLYKQGEN